MAESGRKQGETGSFPLPTKQTSMCSLIIWNISKALEKNPTMDLRHAMRSAHERLARESRAESGVTSQPPEERHLSCAVLAWRQLGHTDFDSLYQFVEKNRNNIFRKKMDSVNKTRVSAVPSKDLNHDVVKDVDSSNFDISSLMGPVVKLPVETKVIMRVDTCSRHSGKKPPKPPNDVTNKIDAACCMDSVCVQRLAELDTAVCELRTRAARLARREAERVELLERAEAAWKDLDLGYQRRLNLAEEKEEDMAKQIEKTIEERNSYKGACTSMVGKLKERGEIAEKERARLTVIEKELCDRACVHLRLSEEAVKGDAALAEQICKATQLDRDLKIKEDQVRRKVSSLESEVQSARCLSNETECALRSELGALKEQIAQVSNQLLAEESECNDIKIQLEELRKEKKELLEDLDGCKVICDNRMEGRMNELKRKREQLKELKEKVIECKCKIPQDVAIEVKRTSSLAALCQCAPEDRLLDSCSCTSIRTQLLSNLLADLFGGLQSELGGTGSLMPCQLLKCLEDKHNWDRSSVVKTNLRNFFEQLLVGELDIAIATSIEKYHAKWVGTSCADQIPRTPSTGDIKDNWQERVIERRAQTLATQLAEQLFKERAEQITKQAKEIVTKGPPPCECKTQQLAAVYQCLVKKPITAHSPRKHVETAPPYIKRALQDVTQLRIQVEDLKKEAVKKEDLRNMEDKITKIVKRASQVENATASSKKPKRFKITDEIVKEDMKISTCERQNVNVKKQKKNEINTQNGNMEKKTGKLFKNIENSFAVNLCLCDTQGDLYQDSSYNKDFQNSVKQNESKNKMDIISSYKKLNMISENNIDTKGIQFSTTDLCPSKCVCFHKIPSNTSIEKLLDTLLKRKGNINDIYEKSILCDVRNINKTDNVGLYSEINNIKHNKSIKCSIVNGIESILHKNSVTEGLDKSTDYDILPATTESEYIGAINLDKSNDNSSKYVNCNNKVKHGDGQEISYSMKPSKFNECQNYYSSTNCDIDLKKESQIYSTTIHGTKFKSADNKLPDFYNKVSKQSLQISGVSHVGEVLKKSDLISCDCEYSVKFLGVTLSRPKRAKNNENKDDKNLIASPFTNQCKNSHSNNHSIKDHQFEPINSKYSGSNDCKFNLVLNTPSDNNVQDKHFKNGSGILDRNKKSCVCCDTEEYSNLELNAFNLLEEYLKEKLEEFHRFSCTSKCISTEEEKILLAKILKKVKGVLLEKTNQFGCKCTGLNINKESWKRAYGLLQEYLKVKLKRVQCSCTSDNGDVDSHLPTILDKIGNLIENDFQRLKDICKCNDKNYERNIIAKKLKEQVTETAIEYNDVFVQLGNDKKISQPKIIANVSTQLLPIHTSNKSCEVMYNELKSKTTAEQKVSCNLKKGYVTDCSCRYALNETDCYRFDNVTANQYEKSTLNKNIEKKDNTLESMRQGNETPTKLLLTSVKKTEEFAKDFDLIQDIQLIFSNPCRKYKLGCCNEKLGICCCTKSLVGINCNKSTYTGNWNKLTQPQSENVLVNKSTDCTFKTHDRGHFCNVEVITADNKEEIVLKYSKESCSRPNFTNNYGVGIDYENNKDDLSVVFNDSIQQADNEKNQKDVQLNKNILFNSLHLPMEFAENSKYPDVDDSSTNDFKSENCECEMVPVCHVKMLVGNIEHKLINSKCTCDSFCFQVCPIHAKKVFNYN